MRPSLFPALLLTVALATPAASAQRRDDPCAQADNAYCYGYLFVGDGRRRTAVVVDGVPVGRTPVLLLLPHLQRHAVRVGALRRRVALRAREVVELELDRATAIARAFGDEAALSALRTRARLGFASAVGHDRCGGLLTPGPLRYDGPVTATSAFDLWELLPAAQAGRVIPRPEEVVALDAAACMRGDAGACETAALAHWNFVGRLPAASDARATELFTHACNVLHNERACAFLHQPPVPARPPALLPLHGDTPVAPAN